MGGLADRAPARSVAGVLLLLASAGCGDPAEPPPTEASAPSSAPRAPSAGGRPWFSEDALEAGVDFRHRYGEQQRFDFPEIMGGGVALFDAEGDGDLDLYLVQSGDLRGASAHGNRFYLNDGRGRFTDVTRERGGGDTGYGMGVAVGDYDRDGDPDLYVTNVGPNVLLRNDGGTLVDVSEQAGVAHPGWGTSAAFADVDGDGLPDLFLVNYLRWSVETERDCSFPKHFRDYCNPNSYKAPARDVLYRNLGGGRFEDVTEAAGLAGTAGNGLGVVAGDFDQDGSIDLYVANDMNANHLWMGDGAGGLKEGGLLAGCALSGTGFAESGMGVQAVDLDSDGDLFLSHLRRQSNTVYSNRGGVFDDTTARLGLSADSLPFTGFGLGFHDFDLDGTLDLFVANGDVTVGETPPEHDPYAQANLLFAGRTAGPEARPVFEEVLPRGGTAEELVATSRGAAFGDLDGDGDVDAVVVNRGERVHLLRNQASQATPERAWALFDVRDAGGSAAIGARVELVAGGRTQWRLVDPAYSYCSASDSRVHFGLGEAERIERVVVHWPRAEPTRFGPFEARAVHLLRQPAGAADGGQPTKNR